MMTDYENEVDPKDKQDIANNNSTDKSDDTLDEEKGDAAASKQDGAHVQDKPDDTLVETVTPSKDSGEPVSSDDGKPITNSSAEQPITNSSNKGQGPSGENL